MTIDRQTLLFFDASCLIAAAGSPNGGSGFLLSLCALGLLQAAVSQLVLVEAERHVFSDLGPQALENYDIIVSRIPKQILPVPSEAELEAYRGLVTQKDQHVIASALAAQAPFLVTLDKPLTTQVNDAALSITALSPGDFIKTFLPEHSDYPQLRR